MGFELPNIDVRSLREADGRGVRVLILDSGIETSHPDLAGHPIRSYRVEADGEGELRRVVEDDGGDVYGHGTAVASIVRRFAPGAVIDSVKVIGRPVGSSHFVVAGLHWGIDQGYDVINCSFTSQEAQHLARYKAAVDRAFCRNVLIVSACNNKEYWRVEYPGSFPSVISTSFADLPGLTIQRRPGELVEFVARGQDVRVAWKGGGHRVISGSSFAAPHITALVARMRQVRGGWNACQVKAGLYAVAEVGVDVGEL
ncbi:MAG: peptidase and in kexin sedolisin [Phycisphaerales bacterium]|nr:peptidase and in kexin sedolisin [Phycisphaerales bacterium]